MPAVPNPDDEVVDQPGRAAAGAMVEALAATGVAPFQPPEPRPSWSDDVVQSYDAYWDDVSSRAARAVDVAIVMRYFDTQEMLSRIFEELLVEPRLLVETNTGSLQSHPHLGMFARLSATAVKLANEIGATPMSRVKLGLARIEGANAQVALEKILGGVKEIEDTAILEATASEEDNTY